MNLQTVTKELRHASIADAITCVCAALLVLLFGYAAASKLNEYHRFVEQMQLAPVPLVTTLAPVLGWMVPQVEIIIVLLLVFERFRNLGLIISFVLLLLFEIYIAAMLLSGLQLPCTCGGLISKLRWREHLIFNAFFMLVAIVPTCYRYYINKHPREYSPRSI